MSDQDQVGMPMFSNLMSLGSLDTSDMQAQISRLPRQGIYIGELGKLQFTEQPPQDPADPMNYVLAIPAAILAFQALLPEEKILEEEMVGRNLNERYFLFGEQIKDAIQLLMGKYKLAGFRYKGIMGGVPGSQPGWVDEAEGKRVAIRVRHWTPKDGQERAAFDWLSPKAMQKAGITWEMMGRNFLDEAGNVIADPLTAKIV